MSTFSSGGDVSLSTEQDNLLRVHGPAAVLWELATIFRRKADQGDTGFPTKHSVGRLISTSDTLAALAAGLEKEGYSL